MFLDFDEEQITLKIISGSAFFMLLKLISNFFGDLLEKKQNLVEMADYFLLYIRYIYTLMLKGLKKKNNAQRNQQAVSKQKYDEKQESFDIPEIRRNLQERCSDILGLFLAGDQVQVKAHLQALRQKEQQYFTLSANLDTEKSGQASKNRFAYEMNYEEETTKKKNKKKPTIPRSQRKFTNCKLCPQENENIFPIATSNYVLVSLPQRKIFPNYPHFIISPIQHQQSRPGLDEDIETEITNFQKCLILYFQKELKMQAIFLEQFVTKNQHLSIQCIGVPLRKAYDLPLYFKQSLETQSNWRTHKSIIEIRKQKGGIRKQIPKQLNYFYIDFGIGYGYAHIVEDEKEWDRKLGYQIVAGATGGDMMQVRTTLQYSKEQHQEGADKFWNKWQKYDWTKYI